MILEKMWGADAQSFLPHQDYNFKLIN